MVKRLLYAWIVLCLWATSVVAVGNEPVTTLPASSPTASSYADIRTFLQQELPAIVGRMVPKGWVRSGGLHATAGSCTSAAFAVEAFTNSGNRVSADGAGGAVAINYATEGCNCDNPGTDTAWVIVSAASGETLGNFTRVGSSNFFVNCTDTTITANDLPANSTLLLSVGIINGAITSVLDRRTPASFVLRGVYDPTDTLYGAVANDDDEDSTAINLALTAAGTAFGTHTGVGIVELPGGAFDLAVSVSARVPANTTFQGVGDATVIRMHASTTTPGIVNSLFDGVSGVPLPEYNITIRDLVVDGNRLTPEGALSSYDNVWNPSTAYLADQYVMNTGETSYKIYKADANCTSGVGTGPATTGTNIVDGTCSWDFVERLWTNAVGSATPGDSNLNTDPILLDGVVGFRIESVTIKKSRNDGIILQLCERGTITKVRAADVNKNAIYASNNEYLGITQNVFTDNFGDIGLASVWYSNISQNVAKRSVFYFIGVGRDSQFVTITSNVGGAGGRFLVVNESITGTAHGKTYAEPYDAFRYGLYHSEVSNNQFRRMQLINAHLNTFVGNFISLAGAELGGFPLWVNGSSQNLFQGNTVYDGTTWGINVDTLADASTGTSEGDILSVQNRFVQNRILAPFDPSGLLGFRVVADSAHTQLVGNVVTLASAMTLYTQHYTITSVSTATFRQNFVGTTRVVLLQDASLVDAEGSFTATGTGFDGTDPTVTAAYRIDDDEFVHLFIPQIQGTSDAQTFTITGMPATIQPARTGFQVIRVGDNGTSAFGVLAYTASNNVLALYNGATASGNTWTASGTKSLFATMVVYPLF